MEQRKGFKSDEDLQWAKKKRFLLVAPLLMLPFVTGAFWALGGGKGEKKAGMDTVAHSGFNANLPQPHFDKRSGLLDKLGFYQKAEMDSARLRDKTKNDPYVSQSARGAGGLGSSPLSGFGSMGQKSGLLGQPETTLDPMAVKANQKLDQLRKIISQPSLPFPGSSLLDQGMNAGMPSTRSAGEIDRLEKLMQAIKPTDSSGRDPQMERLNGMLDKILKIQHPELNTPASPVAAAPLSQEKEETIADDNRVAILGSIGKDTGGNRQEVEEDAFFSFDDNTVSSETARKAISAVVGDDQTLVSGATVRLRLNESVKVNGATLPKDSYVYGTASLSNERLLIFVKSVMIDQAIIPVNWQVFDLDGMAGIYIPGAITRDVAKQSAAEGVNGVALTSLDPSLGAQAASAGIQAAKTLINAKVKLVRVSIKSGYQVLLKETRNSQ